MVNINNLSGIKNLFLPNKELKKAELQQKEKALLEQGGGFDVVDFSTNKTQGWQDIAKEWKEYTDSIWNKPEPNFNSREEREQYWISYYDKYIEYCDKVLSCSDLPETEKSEWTRMKNNAFVDRNNHYRDLNNWKNDNGAKTESFNDVFAEMRNKVPDRTSTIGEKRLALSYIDRMLSCDDIPNAEYWQNKKNVIEMEIQNIKNTEVVSKKEKIADVWKEFSNFTNKYFGSINDNMSMEEKYENRVSYYNAYKTFIKRFMNCSDITETQRAEYSKMESYADSDLHNWELDYQRYKNSQ